MATKILIINRALIKIGSEKLMSEADDNKASRTIAAIYDGLLDRLLRAYRWAFAIKRVQLPALKDKPLYGYQHAYQLPPDCLRIDAVADNVMDGLPRELRMRKPIYQREGRMILTDLEAPIFLRYGARITDPGEWDASFADAFACMLAAEMCESITQSSTKKQAALQDYDLAIKEARASSAIERPPIQQQDTSWFTARL